MAAFWIKFCLQIGALFSRNCTGLAGSNKVWIFYRYFFSFKHHIKCQIYFFFHFNRFSIVYFSLFHWNCLIGRLPKCISQVLHYISPSFLAAKFSVLKLNFLNYIFSARDSTFPNVNTKLLTLSIWGGLVIVENKSHPNDLKANNWSVRSRTGAVNIDPKKSLFWLLKSKSQIEFLKNFWSAIFY